jgi:hypothetical protein
MAIDPATLAMINAGSNVLGSALKSPPNLSSAMATSSGVLTSDNSGFVVNLGSGSASASLSQASLPDWLLIAEAVALYLWTAK